MTARDFSAHGYLRGDLRRLPLASGRFAGAWACASLLHLPKSEVGRALAEIRRILAPGGVLASSVQRGTGELIDQRSSVRLPRFYAHYGAAEWGQQLAGAGLTVEVLDDTDSEDVNVGAGGWITALARVE